MRPEAQPRPRRHEVLTIDGASLEIDEVVAVARHRRRVELAAEAEGRIERCRAMVEVLLEQGEKVYGLTTGFGMLRDVRIPESDTEQLQENLVMSHACGVGEPFAEDLVRAAILLRANTLCRGNSGVRLAVVERLLDMLNEDLYPYIPEKGSVGASGDLAPLSHLALALIGNPEGRFFPRGRRRDPAAAVERASFEDFEPMPRAEALEATAEREGWVRFRPVRLRAKEGLALNNGTQVMTAAACLAIDDSRRLLRFAELATAASLEALRGVRNAYDPRLHEVRPHEHQGEVARRVLQYCAGSQILDLYLNSAHLNRARASLAKALEARAGLEGAAGSSDLPGRREIEELDRLLSRAIPAEDPAGPADEDWAGMHAATPAREQIQGFSAGMQDLQCQAFELLGRAERSRCPGGQELADLRAALHAADAHLREAVPSAPLVQDDYSFRCAPQVLACAHRTLDHTHAITRVEVNSSNDNPLLFPHEPATGGAPEGAEAYGRWLRAEPERIAECRARVLGGGNFHGEPIAVAMDYLAIAMAEVGSISERRTAHLVDGNHSRGLPPFLIENGGLNSGLMIPQYTAAALVSENKVLCHPASVDSVPTSANTEDHVSMGTHAARKALEVVGNVHDIVAIEILCAYQGLGFRRPLAPGHRVRQLLEALGEAGVARYEVDRVPYPDLRRIRELMRGAALLEFLLPAEDTAGSGPSR